MNTWRLPTVDEAVRSMARHGHNSGGVWNTETDKATYEMTPDKESPLWNIHSQVIYWWTATEIDKEHAYIIVYDGRVWPRSKQFGPEYLVFRCVKLQWAWSNNKLSYLLSFSSSLRIWLLPTVDEIVCFMAHHSQNRNGVWDVDDHVIFYCIGGIRDIISL